MLRPFGIAMQLLTRIPVATIKNPQQKELGQSLLFYPLVGLLIGLLLVGFTKIISSIEPQLSAALLLLFWILLTGGIHLDGLADSADAWLGGFGDRERTLTIMKDPYCGPAAVTVLVMVLIVKFSALQAILNHFQWNVLILAPVLSRAVILLLFLTTPYVRSGGIASALVQHIPRTAAWTVLILFVSATIAFAKTNAAISVISVFVVFLFLRYVMKKRIGGTTGDTAGATIELTETAVLVTVVYV